MIPREGDWTSKRTLGDERVDGNREFRSCSVP
jgi:hypothetical protein